MAKPPVSDTKASGGSGSKPIDARFARLHTDPRFVRSKAIRQKVELDDRFKSLFQSDDAGNGSASGSKKTSESSKGLLYWLASWSFTAGGC